VCADAIRGAQLDWLGICAEGRRPSRRCADRLSVRREGDSEGACAPHLLEERSVNGLRKPERDARSVRKAMLLSIDRRVLCLLGVGILEQEPGRPAIPEVSAK